MATRVLYFPDIRAIGGPSGVASWRRLGARPQLLKSWTEADRLEGPCASTALVLADLDALLGLWHGRPARPTFPARPPAYWHIVGVWTGKPCNPVSIHRLLDWGLSEIREVAELSDPGVVEGLLIRARLGSAGARLRASLLMRETPQRVPHVEQIVDGALRTIAGGEVSPARLARHLHVSRATLDRWMKRSGFVPPSTFLHRARLILALFLRQEAGWRGGDERALGFRSSSQLSAQSRRHFDRTLANLQQEDHADGDGLDALVDHLRSCPGGASPKP